MNHDRYDDAYIAGILNSVKTIAMVGASANTNRPSFFAMKYLLGKNYAVIPVNPALAGQEILGRKVVGLWQTSRRPWTWSTSSAIRQPHLDVTRECIRLKDKLGLKVIWMQLSVRNDEAAREAEAAGLTAVMNRCPKIEYGRLSGEIGWAGVNGGLISSKRPQLGGCRRAESCHRAEAIASPRDDISKSLAKFLVHKPFF